MTTLNEIQAQYLANYLPNGIAWSAKNEIESNFRKLLNGLGYEFQNIENNIDYLKRELNIFTTVDFIDYWERAYGIPDKEGVFSIQGLSLEDRRLQLIVKELMDGADLKEQWQAIALCYGYEIDVYPASKDPTIEVSVPKYTIVVDFLNYKPSSAFPWTFGIKFEDSAVRKLIWIFENIKPATYDIMYKYYEGE